MAQKVSVVLVDDIDDSEASETVSFALDGTSYEIDLNEEHANQLRDALAPWVGHARRAGRAPAKRSSSGSRAPRSAGSASGGSTGGGSDRERTQRIREWGRANGHEVSERGRLSAELVAAFEAAQ